jgi:ferredoxin
MTIDEEGAVLSITVDRAKCCGYTLCAASSPAIYSIDDQGFAVVAPDVPAHLETEARRGANSCPDNAIIVTLVPTEPGGATA